MNSEANDPTTFTGLAALALGASPSVRRSTSKFIDTIRDFVGLGFEPNRIRAMAAAEADAKIIAAEADVLVQKIKQDGRLNLQISRADARARMDQERQQLNIESIVQAAAGQLPDDASESPVNSDWTAQFFEHCKNISDKDMQALWSQILSGEVVAPGAFSLRTLSLVRLLSKEEANLFTRFCSTVWFMGDKFDPLVYSPSEKGEEVNEIVTFEELLHLDSIGLIKIHATGLSFGPNEEDVWIYFKKIHRITSTAKTVNKGLPVGVAVFTEAGRQLAALAGVVPNEEYRKSVVKRLRALGWKVDDHIPWPDDADLSS
ncbi:MAG: DUF2806 domain-containing protein [Planctomycetota bacterium]